MCLPSRPDRNARQRPSGLKRGRRLRLACSRSAAGGAARERGHVDVGVASSSFASSDAHGVGDPLAVGAELRVATSLSANTSAGRSGRRSAATAAGSVGQTARRAAAGEEAHAAYLMAAPAGVGPVLSSASRRLREVTMRALLPAVLAAPARVPAPAEPAVAASYEDLAVDLLQRYLQIDTTVPPATSCKGALFFKEVLEREGIRVEVDEFAPGRANLLATLPGTRQGAAAHPDEPHGRGARRRDALEGAALLGRCGRTASSGAAAREDMKTEGDPAAGGHGPREARGGAARPRPAVPGHRGRGGGLRGRVACAVAGGLAGAAARRRST